MVQTYWLIGIVIWVVILSLVVAVGMRGLYNAYIRSLQESINLHAELKHVKELAAAQVQALQEKFRITVDGLRREIRDRNERWMITAYELMDARLYIEVLEKVLHQHTIPLPPKPKKVSPDRPITNISNADQYGDLDYYQELMSPIGDVVQNAGVKL